MKAAIVNPYLDTLGGGERYTLGVIIALLKKGYKVDLEWDDPDIASKITSRFGMNADGLRIVKNVNRGDGYDFCFWVSDGSIPTLRSRNNVLHFQFPFRNVGGKTLLNKMKLFRIKSVVVNSKFTKSFIDREYAVNSVVIYPPVSVADFRPKRKQNIICYVGRFSNLTQKKHQDIVLDAFKIFYRKNSDWSLVLAGGSEVGAEESLVKLRKSAKGFPVDIVESPQFSYITDILGKSKLFWSASGYGVDEDLHPLGVEHFGITAVEAMSAKTIPMLVNKGGHKEIVEDGVDGYLWSSVDELVERSEMLVNNYKFYVDMGKNAKAKSIQFSQSIFEEKFLKLL